MKTEKYSTKPKERMKVFTKGSRIKEEETLILTLPYESEEKKAKILSGEDGFALSFSLGDDYPCVVGGFALGSIAEMDKPCPPALISSLPYDTNHSPVQ